MAIAEVHQSSREYRAIDNARLVAAAPDLLETLEHIARGPCGCEDPEEVPAGESRLICTACTARAAVARATGAES